jgi:hypothetical protein
MREKDIFEEIIDIGKRRGILTYDEINDALPSEFFSPDEIEDLMDILQDMGVKVVDISIQWEIFLSSRRMRKQSLPKGLKKGRQSYGI